MKTKQEYIKAYDKLFEEGLQEHLQDGGSRDNYDSAMYISNVDEIMGYYLELYGDDALQTWLDNLTPAQQTFPTDTEVTNKLKELFIK